MPEHIGPQFSHYHLVALQGSPPIPEPCDELENKWQDVLMHIREAGVARRTVVTQRNFAFYLDLHLCLFPASPQTRTEACWDPEVQAHDSSCIC